jgi:sarcosine oxidase subunit beta
MMRELIDACANGHDHDTSPVHWHGPHTSVDIDLGHYSRLRTVNPESSNSVLG